MKNYKNAPISEVIIGRTYNNKVLDTDALLSMHGLFAHMYRHAEILPPIANEILNGFLLSLDLPIEKTGQILLRLRSDDKKWLLQLQGNKIYLNWIRWDPEPVGNYVGFPTILEQFREVIRRLKNIKGFDPGADVLNHELTYHNRFPWRDYVSSISDINSIMRFCPPEIRAANGFNNVNSQYTYKDERIGGHGTFVINTKTGAGQQQVLQIESSLKGVLSDKDDEEWIAIAHQIQGEYFEQLFREDILRRWE